MISSRWKKVWADFWGNKSRTILIILTILVGTAGIGFVSNLNQFMIESMDSDFLSASPSEAMVYAYPMNEDSVELAREVPGVDAVEGYAISRARVIQTNGQKTSIQFTAIKNPIELTVNTLKPVKDETSISPLGDKEVLIDSNAASLGFKPGDLITVDFNEGKQRKLRFAGYVHAAAGYPYSQTQTIDAYVSPKTLEWLDNTSDFNALAVSVADNPTDQEHVTQVAQAVAKRIEDSGITVTSIFINQPGHHYAYQISQGIFLVMGILGWLTVLLSGFLIVNTITALMSQHTRQIGIMKATGGGTVQIFGMYAILILCFGLIALFLSVPIGNVSARIIGEGMADYLNFYTSPYPGYRTTLVQQTIVALVVPLFAALLPIYNNVRVTVREALTDYGIRGNTKLKRTSVRKGNLLIPRPMRLSLRNAFRRKVRLGLTLFTLVLAGAIFISIYNLWASFYKVIDEFQGYYLADINIGFSHSYRLNKVAAIAEGVPDVESVEGWLEYAGTLVLDEGEKGSDVYFVAPPSTSTLIEPIIIDGRWLTTDDENAVVIGNYFLRLFPDAKVGDWLTVEIDGKESKWQIIGVYSFMQTGGNPLVYVNYEYLARLTNQTGEVQSLRVITKKHDIATQQRVNDQLQALYAAYGVRIGSAQLGADEIQRVASLFDIFAYFFLSMATLIALIGGLGLMSTMSINVMERTREIGVMRAIGASNWDIQSIVIAEGMVVGMISWVISILLSIPITGVMTASVGLLLFNSPLRIVYGWTGIIAWLIGTLIIGTFASVLPAGRAARLTVRDTLAYE